MRQALGLEQGELRSGDGCAGDTSQQRKCYTGECIALDFVCDGFSDCPNAEDEGAKACSKQL